MSISDQVAKLDVESDFGQGKSYEWLRDVASLCFNPPDEDGAEEEIIAGAIVAAAEWIEKQSCRCINTDPAAPDVLRGEVPYDHGDQCERCALLGRYFDQALSR